MVEASVRERPAYDDDTTIRCHACGHQAAISVRVAELGGRTLRCSRCGQRQQVALGQVIDIIYRSQRAGEADEQ